jgi:hypothetical protein
MLLQPSTKPSTSSALSILSIFTSSSKCPDISQSLRDKLTMGKNELLKNSYYIRKLNNKII